MAIDTLGQLLHYLLQTPRTRTETLRATGARPEDLASAISILTANNFLARPVVLGERLLFGVRNSPQNLKVLDWPTAGSHARFPYRDRHRAHAWVEAGILDAADCWRGRGRSDPDSPEEAVRAEEYLSERLGRRPGDREVRLFWDAVDGVKAGPAPVRPAERRAHRSASRAATAHD